jgi:hypothetical protein
MYLLKIALKLSILLSLSLSLLFALNPIYGQIRPDPFTVVLTMKGVDDNTGPLVSWVTVSGKTKSVVYNGTDAERIDKISDNIIATPISFPNGTIGIGANYTACTLVLKNAKHTCDTGFNTSTNVVEFAYLDISPSKLR